MEDMYNFPLSVDGSRLFQGRKILQSSAPLISPFWDGRQGSNQPPSSDHTNFHSTLALVIAAFLCTLVCLLLRRRICCTTRGESEGAFEPAIRPRVERGDNGMNKIDIEALPATVYRKGSPLTVIDCAICLSDFVDGEKLRILPGCSHSFHMDCIDRWLNFNSSCPSCRKSPLDLRFKPSTGVANAAAEASQSSQMRVSERSGVIVAHASPPFYT